VDTTATRVHPQEVLEPERLCRQLHDVP
jgi:hypothetical protein